MGSTAAAVGGLLLVVLLVKVLCYAGPVGGLWVLVRLADVPALPNHRPATFMIAKVG